MQYTVSQCGTMEEEASGCYSVHDTSWMSAVQYTVSQCGTMEEEVHVSSGLHRPEEHIINQKKKENY